ncbi:MAG: hypothetical protein AAFO81_03530 [Pseudomonadota bacterium]
MRRTVYLLCLVGGGALARADAPVELDFFEYLGAMVEVDGEWIDPIALHEQDEVGVQDGASADSDTDTRSEMTVADDDEYLEKIDE